MKTNIGIIGCGNISSAYCTNMPKLEALNLAACADIDEARAKARAEEFHIPWAGSVSDLLANPEIDIIVNLTIPAAHGDVALAALSAGKSVYNEKPLAATSAQAREMMQLAAARNLRIGCAPDTFLGGGLQTCRKLIDDGWIGRPVSATARMAGCGPEGWHPNAPVFYKKGSGPLLDMGPYYLTALTMLLGPVRRVCGSAQISTPERVITNPDPALFGQKISVEVPTHVAAVLDFVSGPVATLVMSFDSPTHYDPYLEIQGTTGTLQLNDPNNFGGDILLRQFGDQVWNKVSPLFGYTEENRGLGVADMASAIRTNRPHRASGELAYHVLDIMESIVEASAEDKSVMLKSSMTRPAPLPVGLLPGRID